MTRDAAVVDELGASFAAMSYHVAILKTARDGTITPIGSNELRDVVGRHHGLTLSEEQDGRLIIHSAAHGSRDFVLQGGEIWTRNPDRDALSLMLTLAAELKGRVRGDEFETYSTPDDAYVHPDDAASTTAAQRAGRAMQRRARLRGYVWMAGALGFGAVLGLAVEQCAKR